MKNRYLSVISNFGCHFKCPYCITKRTGIDVPKTTIQGLDKLVENIRKYDCNWVSVSGGGDPVYNFGAHTDWWSRFFDLIPEDVKTELHTSYISVCKDETFTGSFDRIVYHCHSIVDLYKIRRIGDQIVRAVFVVTGDFDQYLIDKIVRVVKDSSEIDELSFRQMVDSDYNTTHYCENYLKDGHGKDWYYIQQCDYNIYYAENEVKFKFEDFRKTEHIEDDDIDPILNELAELMEDYKRKVEEL